MAQNEALGQLTEEQREKVRGWLDEGKSSRTIAKEIGKAEPEGFGIEVSHMAVERFRQKLAREKIRDELAEQEAMAVDLMEMAGRGAVDYRQATVQILQRKVFSAAAEAKGEAACEMLRKLVEMEQRQHRIALAERNHELSRLRFEMNTSREVLKKAALYVKIHQLPAVDDETKVRAARQICFGAVDDDGKDGVSLTEGDKGNGEGKNEG